MKNLNPDWGEEVLYQTYKLPASHKTDPFIRITVEEANIKTDDAEMGMVTIPLKSLVKGEVSTAWYKVENSEDCDDATGELQVWILIDDDIDHAAVKRAAEAAEAAKAAEAAAAAERAEKEAKKKKAEADKKKRVRRPCQY
jgi:hypothetical protein